MAYKIFADTNVYLDHLLQRIAGWQYARDIFALAEQREIIVFTSASSLINVLYALRQQKNLAQADIIMLIKYILSYTKLLQTGEAVFMSALSSGFTDLEDGIQYYTALGAKDVDYFITSNIKDYKKAVPQLTVLSPRQFIALYHKK